MDLEARFPVGNSIWVHHFGNFIQIASKHTERNLARRILVWLYGPNGIYVSATVYIQAENRDSLSLSRAFCPQAMRVPIHGYEHFRESLEAPATSCEYIYLNLCAQISF